VCGVVAGLGPADLRPAVRALAHRGPDARGLVAVGGVALGHTRLAVLDPDARADQPFRHGDVTLSYNGELWNHRALRGELAGLGGRFATTGDTEVAAAALDRWGPGALPRMEGMFALAWTTGDGLLHLARDRFGETPLHYAASRSQSYAASEVKALHVLGVRLPQVADVGPGEHLTLAPGGRVSRDRWYAPPAEPVATDRGRAARDLRKHLDDGVAARSISDVPVCTLLSGGVDSAAVAHGLTRRLGAVTAYTAVYDRRSRDLRCARQVAAALGAHLAEVPVPAPTADDLARVVRAVELDYKAQVEIGWPCLKLAEAMRCDGYKVTFSGEGSDELWASYGFAYHGLKTAGWHDYRRGLFLAQARKNFARANKAFMAHGVECRLPFLQTPLVEFALSLPRHAVQDGSARPKAVLQDAYADVLPAEVVRRPKLAFQDGMGIKTEIARRVAAPARFYRAELRRAYG
jgi:asparagine synthase (glutamine-hydrolysing)